MLNYLLIILSFTQVLELQMCTTKASLYNDGLQTQGFVHATN